MVSELLSHFGIPVAIAALVGLEREIYQQKTVRSFAGIRTYILTGFLAALCSYLLIREEWRIFAYLVLAGLVFLVVSAYTIFAMRGYYGMTTELSVFIVFLLSFMATYSEYQKIAIIFGVVLVVILSLKDRLHKFARDTQTIEWYDALTFIVMAFVVLPLLPNKSFSVLGVAEAINPYRTWLMVVFVSGVNFLGYVLSKVIGGSYGIGLAGLVGGMVSSTAVAESMSTDSNRNPVLINSYAFGVISACVVTSIRVLFEVLVLDGSMLSTFALPILVMAAVGVAFVALWIEKDEVKKRKVGINLGSPLALKPALLFGALFLLVGFLSRAVMMYKISDFGFSVLGAVAGLIEVNAITLSMVSLFSHGEIAGSVAWSTITLAVISNTFFKLFITKIFGSIAFYKKVGLALFVMAVAGIIALLIQII